jgi:hypothetical protein
MFYAVCESTNLKGRQRLYDVIDSDDNLYDSFTTYKEAAETALDLNQQIIQGLSYHETQSQNNGQRTNTLPSSPESHDSSVSNICCKLSRRPKTVLVNCNLRKGFQISVLTREEKQSSDSSAITQPEHRDESVGGTLSRSGAVHQDDASEQLHRDIQSLSDLQQRLIEEQGAIIEEQGAIVEEQGAIVEEQGAIVEEQHKIVNGVFMAVRAFGNLHGISHPGDEIESPEVHGLNQETVDVEATEII